MKALLIACAGLLFCSCDNNKLQDPAPQAEKVASDNRIGQGTISYTSTKKENTTITFVAESFTRASYYFEFTEIRKDKSKRNIYYNTSRLGYGDTVRIKAPIFIPKTSKLRVKEYYQDVHPEPVLLGTFNVERVNGKK